MDWGHRSRIFACSSDKVKQIESRVEDVFLRLYWDVKEGFYCGCSSLWKSILIMKWWQVFNVSRVLLDKSLSYIYREKNLGQDLIFWNSNSCQLKKVTIWFWIPQAESFEHWNFAKKIKIKKFIGIMYWQNLLLW